MIVIGPRRSVLPWLALATATVANPATAHADDVPPSSITVEGVAEAELVPDTARITLGVAVQRPTARAAAADLAAVAQAVRAAIGADGVAPTDIATAGLDLGPVEPPDIRPAPGSTAPPPLFRAATSLRVTIRSIDRLEPILSHLIDNGANTVDGVTFDASGAEARRDGLRADAVRDAQRKAEIYASALGLHLGRVIEVMPTGDGFQPQGGMLRAVAAKAAMPVEAGTLALQTAVTVRWRLEP